MLTEFGKIFVFMILAGAFVGIAFFESAPHLKKI